MRFIFICLLLVSFNVQAADWKNFKYTVYRVSDGDTITATDGNVRFNVRIAGMDAPEKAQQYGKVASMKMRELLDNKEIQIEPVASGRDMYGRVLAKVYVNGKEVALNLIEEGYATYYRPKCEDYPANDKNYDYDPRPYVEAEKKARANKLNFWSVKGPLPCEFRKSKK
ncbi:thermonuclease family protein [bacterium]|nr:thermonuclease family protein [bacterium]